MGGTMTVMPEESTPDDYPVGAIKQDPVTKSVAIRTAPGMPLPWSVMTVNRGGYHATHQEVAEWVDFDNTPVEADDDDA
jgi:hypothetical protein